MFFSQIFLKQEFLKTCSKSETCYGTCFRTKFFWIFCLKHFSQKKLFWNMFCFINLFWNKFFWFIFLKQKCLKTCFESETCSETCLFEFLIRLKHFSEKNCSETCFCLVFLFWNRTVSKHFSEQILFLNMFFFSDTENFKTNSLNTNFLETCFILIYKKKLV